MKNAIRHIIGAVALLFVLLVPSFAQSEHITNDQVNSAMISFGAHGSNAPDFIYAAWWQGDGVTVWADGSWKLDNETQVQSPYSAYSPGVFADVYYRTGDPMLAACAAIQYYLTHDEWADLNNVNRQPVNYFSLNWFPQIFNAYGTGDGGGDDHDNT